MIRGLVSTIIPVYNRPELLVEAVESVLAQSYRPIEVVIIDDGSTDVTPDVATALAAKYSRVVQSIRQTNAGPGRARQTGLGVSRGEFIQYLDSDDVLLPQKFELQVAELRTRPDCDVAYGKTRFYKVGATPSDVPLKLTGERIQTMFPLFLRSRWWATATPLYRRSILDSIGPWTELRNEEDWEYDCRIAARNRPLAYCDAFVSDHRWHEGERLSTDGSTDAGKLRDRAEAHRLIYGHARRAGMSDDCAEMQHFSREAFLLARQCGAAGLGQEARNLFYIARDASGAKSASAFDFRLYKAIAQVLGWTAAGSLACRFERVRGALTRSVTFEQA